MYRRTVFWDWKKTEEEQQQEGISTRERFDYCENRESYYSTIQDCLGKYLTQEREILNRWTEYCSELYNCKTSRDSSVLNCPQTDTEDDHLILHKEVEAAVQSLRKGKSARIENIPLPAELIQAGGEAAITALLKICNRIWQTGERPLDPVLGHHTSQERQPAAVPELSNNQPNQPSKQSLAEDHTGQTEAPSREAHCWRTGKLQSRKEHHRAGLQPENPMWETSPAQARPLPRNSNVSWCLESSQPLGLHQGWSLPCLHWLKEGLQQGLVCSFVGNNEEIQHQCQPNIRLIKHLYDKATSAVLFNSSREDWFRTKAGIQQGCLLSTTLFNIFLERIIADALEDHEGSTAAVCLWA